VLNKAYAIVRVVNKVAILNEHLDPEGKPTFSLLSPDSFRLLIANRSIDVAGKRVPLSNVWIGSPRRRQYEGITFAPGRSPAGYYNLWRGFAAEPSQSGSCASFKAHLRENVCQGSDDNYDWVFGWFAHIFQHPDEKCGTALVLRGPMGVGKTIVGETFGYLLGPHYVQVADPRYVTGRFNAHLVRCLLFHCDEAFWAGDHAAEGKLKDLVTGRRHPIELKGYEAFFVPNYVRIFINGNPDWLVPAGLDERRFATLDVGEVHKQDIRYFRAIVDELEQGGYGRLLHELLTFDLSKIELRVIPKTDALLEQKIASMTAEQAWWLDMLHSGQLPGDREGIGKCPAEYLTESYLKHAQKQGARRRAIETQLGIFLGKVTARKRKKLLMETYEVWDVATFGWKPKRGTVHQFPSLGECRDAFQKMVQNQIDWKEDPDHWVAERTEGVL
jgi:hypothetical protein